MRPSPLTSATSRMRNRSSDGIRSAGATNEPLDGAGRAGGGVDEKHARQIARGPSDGARLDVLVDHERLVVTVTVEIGHDQLLDGAERCIDSGPCERGLSEGLVRAGSRGGDRDGPGFQAHVGVGRARAA